MVMPNLKKDLCQRELKGQLHSFLGKKDQYAYAKQEKPSELETARLRGCELREIAVLWGSEGSLAQRSRIT